MTGSTRRHVFLLTLAATALPSPAATQDTRQSGIEAILKVRIDGNASNFVPLGPVAERVDGLVAVAQPMDGTVLIFDSTGRSHGSFGRIGSGPGEFRHISHIGWIADTIWVYDGRLKRFTLFSSDLDVVRTIAVPSEALPGAGLPAFRTVYPQSLYGDGSVHAVVATPVGTAPEGWGKGWTPHVRLGVDSRISHAIGSVPDPSSHEEYGYFHPMPNGGVKGRHFPLVQAPDMALSSNGNRIAYVEPMVPANGRARLRIRMMDPDGVVLYERTFARPAARIPDGVREDAIENVVERMVRPGQLRSSSWSNRDIRGAAEEWEERARQHVPEMYSLNHGSAVAGNDGSLWIPLLPDAHAQPWFVIDPAGQPVGVIAVSANARIVEAGAGHFWAVELDENDVPSLLRYSVRPVR